MKTFYQYTAIVAAILTGLCACSDDDSSSEASGKAALAQPQIIVSDLTTTGFSLRWDAVEDAASYLYVFDGGAETATAECRLSFTDLERRREYVVAVKACPRDAALNRESDYAYIHVVTDDLEQLPAPQITLGSAYASKTVITWSEVPGTELYEVTLDGGEPTTTPNRKTVLSNLRKGQAYTFTVRALTPDATRYTNSQPASLEFETSADDVPALLIAPTTVISDAVAFDIYAASDMTYFYEILPATSFIKYDEQELIGAFRDYIVDFAKKQGISMQLAMASMLKSGTQSLKITGLTPELSYVVFAFGMNLKGEITSPLSTTTIKTTANGYSDGPNYGGSDSFTQRFFITNAYAFLTGYGWTNSVWTYWKGDDITDIRYRILSTEVFNQAFPDPFDRQTIAAVLKQVGTQLDPALLSSTVNSSEGYNSVTPASAGSSYTLLTVATSSSGEETVCVNSVTTKTDTKDTSWFHAALVSDETWGPAYNTIGGVMSGDEIASCRYLIVKETALAGIPATEYADLIEKHGRDVAAEYIPAINGPGFAMIFGEQAGVEPETSYVFLATAVNTVGDRVTRWDSATTAAAPEPAPEPSPEPTRRRSDERFESPVGRGVALPADYLFPMKSRLLPADAKAEGDYWTIIHNTHNIK